MRHNSNYASFWRIFGVMGMFINPLLNNAPHLIIQWIEIWSQILGRHGPTDYQPSILASAEFLSLFKSLLDLFKRFPFDFSKIDWRRICIECLYEHSFWLSLKTHATFYSVFISCRLYFMNKFVCSNGIGTCGMVFTFG